MSDRETPARFTVEQLQAQAVHYALSFPIAAAMLRQAAADAERLTQAADAFRTYGQHLPDCGIAQSSDLVSSCTCGYDKAWEALAPFATEKR